jgi:riboflavin biosynthesis pyrimidine reductase
MRRVRYVAAMTLDGYIAGPKGEADWIIMDPEIDFGAILRQFDTVLMGRRRRRCQACRPSCSRELCVKAITGR